jgi:hypothetical protein
MFVLVLKRLLIVFALLTGIVHVMNIYLMPNITHRPLAKEKLHLLQTLTHKQADTSSESPYKAKFRSFFCQTGEKKISLAVAAPQELIAGSLTFRLSESLFSSIQDIFHFNVSYLKSPPKLILTKCCWLI